MSEPHSFDRAQFDRAPSMPPEDGLESTWRYVSERMRERPDLLNQIRQAVDATLSLPPKSTNPALADTVSLAQDSSRNPHLVSTPFLARRFGDYELIQEVARGGMGVVYKARQLSLDRTVALKMILTGQLADADDVKRFRIEAQAAANLDHPGIVPIFEIGEHQGQHFYSMGFIEGHSLASELRDGPIAPRKAAEYSRKVAEAIAFAHRRGVIHRDLKPGNVLVDQSGEPKVTDFGLAKRTNAESDLTGTGHVLGTPAFMPPEQASGRVDLVNEAADVYSLGAMLYCLLTRRPPFQAANPIDTLRQVIDKEPVSLRQIDPSIPKDLETICLKCLRKEPAQRYASAQALAEDLMRWLQGEPIQARPVSQSEKFWMWCKRKPVIAAMSTAIVLGVLVGSAVFWERQNASRAAGLVDALAKAEPTQVSAIIAELEQVDWWAEPRLRKQLATEGTSLVAQRLRLHSRLALAGSASQLADPLVDDLLAADFRDVANVRDALKRCSTSKVARLWEVLHVSETPATPDQRFRAGLALAGLDTQSKSWTSEDHRFLVEQLVASNPVYQPVLWDLLTPLKPLLIEPLEAAFVTLEQSESSSISAANALAFFAHDDVPRLAHLLTHANLKQDEILFPVVAAGSSATVIDDLSEVAASLPSAEMGYAQRILFGEQRANAAISLLRLGERERVLPVFHWQDDPEALTQFVFRCKERGIQVETLLDLLEQVSAAPDRYPVDSRYALLLAIGEHTANEIPELRREALVSQLTDWYANDPSSGVHSAAGWLLRHLGHKEVADRIDQTPVPYSPDREWFTLAITVSPAPYTEEDLQEVEAIAVGELYGGELAESGGQNSDDESNEGGNEDDNEGGNEDRDEGEATSENTDTENTDAQNANADEQQPPPAPPASPMPPKTFYYTFIVFPAGDYLIGSVEDEPLRRMNETRHTVTLTRPFAVLDREISAEELIALRPSMYLFFIERFGAGPLAGGLGADWYDSVGFCWWLGNQMGLAEADQAYPSPRLLDAQKYPREPNPLASWAPRDWPVDLDRRGFRLPTDAEWEVACRAGARTTYGFGSDANRLERFAWYSKNSGNQIHPPRQLRPSRRGLFDFHGNLIEWTHDWRVDFGAEAVTDPLGVKSGSRRVLRGGSWDLDASLCRSADRNAFDPVDRSGNFGFRIAMNPISLLVDSDEANEAGAPEKDSTESTESQSNESQPLESQPLESPVDE